MELKQFELLLNQLFDCSLAINDAIKNGQTTEIDKLIEAKEEKLQLIDDNIKFINDLSQFKTLIEKIRLQENENISLLSAQKDEIGKKTKQNLANTRIVKKYEQLRNINGSIVDVRE